MAYEREHCIVVAKSLVVVVTEKGSMVRLKQPTSDAN